MSRWKRVCCVFCGKETLSKDEIGLNKKLMPRQIERMMCMSCMAAYFDTQEDFLQEKIEDFKRQGCVLFE